ncbi:S-formylglutathione hydrolase FrmB [Nocardia tenerifensis]|uniref:S-formylglutathione hydrolase FrmB n=2 Tax=Nocardia tenerifensis TaxID=228006 RepID=A0A318K5Y6_9NOCA|nr:S-formylglutathione hydrolase FrmB [Nocardia tenerifensis]
MHGQCRMRVCRCLDKQPPWSMLMRMKSTYPSAAGRSRVTFVAGTAVAGLLVGVFAGFGAVSASADPGAPRISTDAVSADGSRITEVARIDEHSIRLQVHSSAMDKTFPVEVVRPADTSSPRPTLYLLNGADGGEGLASWQVQTDIPKFMADKNANLVIPVGGPFSYYADWIKDDPVLGRNKWKTYLTEELPPLIDAALGANGVNAIAGISTAGTTVLTMPIAKPGLYKAAAAYSGCAQTSDKLGTAFVKSVVGTGGGNAENMWGPPDSPEWLANDAYTNAEKLRGLDLYLSSGDGSPGKYDTVAGRAEQLGGGRTQIDGDDNQLGVETLINQIAVGGVIEAVTNFCTRNMQQRLDSLGIPATFHYASGTHSWGYWQDEFKRSWPFLSKSMGLSQ